jgi:hypothetical protein
MTKPVVLLLFPVILLLISLSRAQDEPITLGAPGCGDPNIKFNVKTDNDPHPVQPEPGKALLYFIEDDSEFSYAPKPTTRMGLDGSWVGATHGNSYFFVPLNPGVHHLCASWQNFFYGPKTAAAHFTAEAGQVYYFSARNVSPRGGYSNIRLEPPDSDEAQLLINQFSCSTSQPKKVTKPRGAPVDINPAELP